LYQPVLSALDFWVFRMITSGRKQIVQPGSSPLLPYSERRTTHRFRAKLPLLVRWTTGTTIEEVRAESRDVSSRGIYFFLPNEIKNGSSIEIVLTLSHEITQAASVRVRCFGRVQRSGDKEEGRLGIVATIERYEFLRSVENAA
jgi:hypothetical protein